MSKEKTFHIVFNNERKQTIKGVNLAHALQVAGYSAATLPDLKSSTEFKPEKTTRSIDLTLSEMDELLTAYDWTKNTKHLAYKKIEKARKLLQTHINEI